MLLDIVQRFAIQPVGALFRFDTFLRNDTYKVALSVRFLSLHVGILQIKTRQNVLILK